MGPLATLKSLWQLVPQRYIVVIMTFFSLVSIQTMSSSLSLTITQMVKTTIKNVTDLPDELQDHSCPYPAIRHLNTSMDAGIIINDRFDWSEQMQGIILGSSYIGYVILHVPGGVFAERFGGKAIIVSGLLITFILTLLTPIIVTAGDAYALIAVRVIIGSFQGGMFPAVSTIISAWVPTRERSLLGSFVFCGFPCGAIIGNFVSGLILDAYQDWRLVFYTFGIMSAVVTVLYALLCTSNPSTHPFITNEEKNYLHKQLGQLEREQGPPTPWKAILTSKPVLALMIDMCLGDWAYFVLMIDLPKYMNDVLHVSIRENGIYSSLPWAMRILVSFIAGYIGDWIISTGRLSITNARKLFVAIAAVIDGSFVLAAAYAGCDAMLVGAFFIISVGSQGFISASSMINPMDLSPNFSGTITGFTNGIGSVTGIIVPWVIGILTPNSLQSEWRIVFWISFFVHMTKIVNYTAFGSGEVQPWNDSQGSRKPKIDSNEMEALTVT